MDSADTSTTLVLDRRVVDASVRDGSDVVRAGRCADLEAGATEAPPVDGGSGLGDLLRAPGLILLAAVFLVEGYAWLGVVHVGPSSAGAVLAGSPGRAAVALLAPLAALVLTPRRRDTGWVLEDVVLVAALGATAATGTALVVGGTAWRDVAGATDLVLAATAFGAVVAAERARRRAASAGRTPTTV